MSMKIKHNYEHERALIFLERKTIVHVSRVGDIFHNGLLLEVGNDFFILKDRVEGKEMFILFKELKRPLEQCNEVSS